MRILTVVTSILMIAGCKTLMLENTLDDADQLRSTSIVERPQSPKMCAALRGNGNYVFAHWGALARLIEDFGPIEGIAGGSSGAVTSFIYENMYRSPAVWRCEGSRSCTNEESSMRLSLMLRSLTAYLDRIKEKTGLMSQVTGKNKVLMGLKVRKIRLAIENEDYVAANDQILSILSKKQFEAIINPAVIDQLERSQGDQLLSAMAVKDVLGAVEALQWKIDDSAALFRHGLLKMSQLGDKGGVLADFYAGLEGTSGEDLGRFLDGCAATSRGQSIQQVFSKLATVGLGTPAVSCAELFFAAVDRHYDRVFREIEEDGETFVKVVYQSKSIDEPVGKYLPVVAANSFFSNREGIAKFAVAKAEFQKNRMPPSIGFDFDWMRFGYYARSDELSMVIAGAQSRQDLRSRKAEALGERTWREILELSPLEPGIDSAQCLLREGDARHSGEWRSIADVADLSQCQKISTGGWADLEPVAVLKDIGCQDVVMVQRAGPATTFAVRMTSFLSANEAQSKVVQDELFDLSSGSNSSYAWSIEAASGVLCTNWDEIPQNQISCLVQHAYDSRILTLSPLGLASKLAPGSRPAHVVLDGSSRIFGCSVGATPDSLRPAIGCLNAEEED